MNKRQRDLLVEITVLFGVGLIPAAIGALSLHARYPSWFWIIPAFFFAAGLLFEILSRDLWDYPRLVFRIPFVRTDLSFSLPFGWMGLMTSSFALSLWLRDDVLNFHVLPVWRFHSALDLILPGAVVAFFIGNLVETLFHHIGFFVYTDKFWKIFGRSTTPWGIPWAVSIGYGGFWGILLFSGLQALLLRLS